MNPLMKKIFLGLVVVLLMATVGVVVLRFLQKPAGKENGEPSTTKNTLPTSGNLPSSGQGGALQGGQASDGAVFIPSPIPQQATEEQVLLQKLTITARDFTERYGSYSTEGDFANLEALLPVMTARFRNQTQTVIEKNKAQQQAAQFVGVTTKALSVKPEGQISADTPASVLVQSQQTTSKSGTSEVSYATLALTLVYNGALWKVDTATWQ